jgi:hypothetical protein
MSAQHAPERAPTRGRARATASMRLAVLLACAAGLAIAIAGCGGGDNGPRDPVLDRAAKADSSFGVRYRFHDRFTHDHGITRLRGYGQAEADRRRTREVAVVGDVRVETIIDGDDEYRGGDFTAADLLDSPKNVRWTKLDRSRFLDAGYLDKVCGLELPAKIADVLADSGPTVEKLGAARIGDVRTRRYRVTTTYGRVLDVLAGDDDASQCDKHDRAARFVAELWIDGRDLVRRARLRNRLVGGLTTETIDITRYDRAVRVAVPTGPGVGDITDAAIKIADSLCKTADAC